MWSYYGKRSADAEPAPYYGYGYRGYYGKRSADAEPKAEPKADPKADPSVLYTAYAYPAYYSYAAYPYVYYG